MIETSPFYIAAAAGKNPIACENLGRHGMALPPFTVAWRGENRSAWEVECGRRGAVLPAFSEITGYLTTTTYGVKRHVDGRYLAWRLPAGGLLSHDSRTWSTDLPQTADYKAFAARCTAVGIAPLAR
jgi:hypothetical protein